jgi:ketosteroid isomerase-like protein
MSATPESSALARRIARLEARVEIRELVARYCFVVDARDIEGIGECFTHDGAFRSRDGQMDAVGRAAVIEQFHARFAVLGPSNHFTHDHIINFDDSDAAAATGLINTHAEVVRNGQPLWASLRYRDEYRHEEGRWRFRERSLEFFYYLQPAQYAEVMLSALRNHAYAVPHAAEFPETLPSWQRYYQEHPRPSTFAPNK